MASRPERRCGARAMAAPGAPRRSTCVGSTNDFCASASSMVRIAGRSSYAMVARKAASRAWSRLSAATA